MSTVRYACPERRPKGVASTFLADRTGVAQVYVQPAYGFKLPAAGDVPMIMVGPGAGTAPFRSFSAEREASGAKGRNWLFFGDQKRDADFLCAEQLSGWVASGLLSRLDLASSRDRAAKIYVPDRLWENRAELWSWLEAGAHAYVCGHLAAVHGTSALVSGLAT